jgi:hypothetical protein
MASETESNAPSAATSPYGLASDVADISIGSEGQQSQFEGLELPEHNEHSIYHGDKTYKRGKARPAKRRDRPHNAWYWKHGEEISEDKQRHWMCELCWKSKKFTHYAQTSNRAIIRHLEDMHNITEDNPTNVIQLHITPADNRSGNLVSITPSIFDWEILKLRLIEWIVVMHIAFSQVENDWFRRFLAVISPSLEKWIPKASNTVKSWILAEFERRQEDIKKQIQASKSRIHLSFDLWTSPNHLSFVGVVGHYMSSQYKVETVLLGLRRLHGPHSGENIAEAVLKVVHKYGLTGNQIGWFVLDNATSNDTCVAEILKALNIDDTVEHRRLRCLGHIINLGAKACLFGPDPNDFEKGIEVTQQFEEEKKEQEIWRKQGPIGKLHNVVTYIRKTPQRREEFEEKVKEELKKQKDLIAATAQPDEDVELVMKEPLMVVQDNKTRWNSIFCMILRAFLLKDPLDLFIKRALEKPKENSPLPKDDELSTTDWDILAHIRDILQPFFDQTLRLQGRASCATHGSIWEALPTLDFLLNELEVKSKDYGVQLREHPSQATESTAQTTKKSTKSAKKAVQKPVEGNDAPGTVHLSSCINSSWMKLRKYYRLMDQSPVYAAAVVLNPEHKWDYFKTNWEQHPEWIAQAEESVEDLWLTMYKDSANSTEAEHEHGQNSSFFLPTPRKEPTDFDQWVSRRKYKRPGVKKQDEYNQYLATEHLPGQQESEEIQSSVQLKSVDLCAFWARYEAQYPSLARMAFDILSIPAMSAECERVFSSAKLLLTDRRARMKEDTIEASECLRAWFQAGRFTQ